MSIIEIFNSYKNLSKDYDTWRNKRDINNAKSLEYIKKNPNVISKKDIQKNKALIRAVDLMDEFTYKKTKNMEIMIDSTIGLALKYSAIGGATIGFLATRNKYAKNFINKIAKKHNRTANLLNTSIVALTSVLCTILSFPIYNWASKTENKAYRKTHQEVMRETMKNPKIFTTFTEEQELKFQKNLENTKKPNIIKDTYKTFNDKVEEFKHFSTENKEEKIKNKFLKFNLLKLENDFEEDDDIINQKERELVINLADKIRNASLDYQENAEIVTNTAITLSFALGSIIALGYERFAKKLNFNINTLPANLGLFLMLGTTLLSASIQKRAGHVGRFKIKQELMNNPEQLTLIKDENNEIKDIEIKRKNMTIKDFLKNFVFDYLEYEKWKKDTFAKEKNLNEAFRNIDISEEQLDEAKGLQKNVFFIFNKLDQNTQKHAESILVIGQAVQYPITLLFNTLAGLFGLKHLTTLSKSTNKKEILSSSSKYILTILALSIPSIIINTKITKDHKKALKISDMLTIKELEKEEQ